jgi:DNA (cytosine-5)-methyltransferase 1
MLPTPIVSDWNTPASEWREENDRNQLRDIGALLPTPTSQAAKHGETPDTTANGFGSNLWDLPHLLPTPAVNDMGEGKTLEWWDDWAPRQKSSDGRPAPHGKSLAIEALRASHGATTVPPSPDGNTSSDDPHPNLLSLDVQGIPA